jgi:hypothetical protein
MSWRCSESGDASGFRGCGRDFGSMAAFDRHWTRATKPDDPNRDRQVVTIGGTRCATDADLRRRGIDLDPRGVWHDVPEADRVRTARAKGSFRPRRGSSEASPESSPHVGPGEGVSEP